MALDIQPKFCKGCGICVNFCPKKVLDLDEIGKIYAKEPDKCIMCGQCELRCPDYAIKVVRVKREG
jgi:2-oxoglutarate ferredoxin oxidoreductase subunit delta